MPDPTPKKDPKSTGASPRDRAPATPRADHNAEWDAEDGAWRHGPVAPKDESPVRSLGESVGDVVTGSGQAPENPRKKPDR